MGNLDLDGRLLHVCTAIGNLDSEDVELSTLIGGVTDVEFSSISMNFILSSVSGNILG